MIVPVRLALVVEELAEHLRALAEHLDTVLALGEICGNVHQLDDAMQRWHGHLHLVQGPVEVRHRAAHPRQGRFSCQEETQRHVANDALSDKDSSGEHHPDSYHQLREPERGIGVVLEDEIHADVRSIVLLDCGSEFLAKLEALAILYEEAEVYGHLVRERLHDC